MKHPIARLTLCLLIALTAVTVIAAPAAAADEAEQMTQRVPLPTLSAVQNYPYTIEIPVTWEPRREIPAPGVFLGPPGSQPDTEPDMVFVRWSSVDLSDPQQVADAIKENAEKQPWKAEEVKLFDVDGHQGVWVLMEIPGDGTKPARRTLTVKLPVKDGSVDVMATAPVDEFKTLQPEFEHILASIRPAGEE